LGCGLHALAQLVVVTQPAIHGAVERRLVELTNSVAAVAVLGAEGRVLGSLTLPVVVTHAAINGAVEGGLAAAALTVAAKTVLGAGLGGLEYRAEAVVVAR